MEVTISGGGACYRWVPAASPDGHIAFDTTLLAGVSQSSFLLPVESGKEPWMVPHKRYDATSFGAVARLGIDGEYAIAGDAFRFFLGGSLLWEEYLAFMHVRESSGTTFADGFFSAHGRVAFQYDHQ
jgi:hypothetical protein